MKPVADFTSLDHVNVDVPAVKNTPATLSPTPTDVTVTGRAATPELVSEK